MKSAPSSLREHLAIIRARTVDETDYPEHIDPWSKAAATLVMFDPFSLKAAGSGQLPDTDAVASLLEESEPASSGNGDWSLTLSERRRVLRHLGSRAAMRDALAANGSGPDLPAQRAFALLISEDAENGAFVMPVDDADALRGLLEVLNWVEGILPGLPEKEKIEKARARSQIIGPLRRLIGDHFVGRNDVLEHLSAYLAGSGPAGVLFIHGPGGIGKSTIMAKFALEVIGNEDVGAIVYLNLDRPILRPLEPMTLVQEMLRQLAAQFTGAERAIFDEAEQVTDYLRSRSTDAEALSTLESAGSGAGKTLFELLDRISEHLKDLLGDAPILVMIDTFEQAQRHGQTIVYELWSVFDALTRNLPSLRVIAAGRVELDDTQFHEIQLEPFDRSQVRQLLENISETALEADLVEDVFRLTDGHPLTVRLAGLMLKNEGIAKFEDRDTRALALGELKSSKVDAILYGRVLGQIGDANVQKLAIPGLVMRRIYQSAIREVLAGPCGMDLKDNEEFEIFEAMKREVDLVDIDGSDPDGEAIVHRPDIRKLILKDLRSTAMDRAKEIDAGAIAYFGQRESVYARAEEIYHRLWHDETFADIEARWTSAAGQRLLPSLTEFPARVQAWLAEKLGVDVPEEVADLANLEDWERTTARTARRRLARGNVDGALKALGKRNERSPDSPLFAIEAEALSHRDDFAGAMAVLEQGILSSTKAGNQSVLAELLLTRANQLERQRKFAAASRDTSHALEIANKSGETEYRLRATALLLRLNRKSKNAEGPQPEELIEEANLMLDDTGEDWLRGKPTLLRELAAEIGPHRPTLVASAVKTRGGVRQLQAISQSETLAQVVKDQFATIGDPVLIDLSQQPDAPFFSALQRNMSRIVNAAERRGNLAAVAVPVSTVLAADVDHAIGVLPSSSMLLRSKGWRTPGSDT